MAFLSNDDKHHQRYGYLLLIQRFFFSLGVSVNTFASVVSFSTGVDEHPTLDNKTNKINIVFFVINPLFTIYPAILQWK